VRGVLSGPAYAADEAEKPFSVDSQRNILAEAKTFLRWSAAKPRRWISRSPLEEVQGVGRRKHGKAQLRIDEARKWSKQAVKLAKSGDEGAVAALMSLLMGMRASEIVSRVVRDLDDDARLLWIPDAKTDAGKRTLEVPHLLRPCLRKLAKGKRSEAPLFGQHWRDWIRKQVKRICKLAKGARGDGARDAGPPRNDRGGGGRDGAPRGRVAWSRVVRDQRAELREAGSEPSAS